MIFMSLTAGILLTATSVDGNGSLFPLVYSVVDAENDSNWLWFLEHLRNVLTIHTTWPILNADDDSDKLVFLSARQKGLIEGVDCLFPHSPHAYCLRHLKDNIHKQFKHPELKTLLWKAASAPTGTDFNKALEDMRT